MANKIEFLGTGTSQGVPMIGCNCEVCRSDDFRDKRLRTSAYIEYEGLRLVIDAGPDFRQQMLRSGIKELDAVLLTHMHKDHTGGLDDVRAYNYFMHKGFPIYAEVCVQESLKREYAYAFGDHRYPGVPDFILHAIDEHPFNINGVEIIPVRAIHYRLPVLGFRFGRLGYLTDANSISEESIEKFKGVDVFVISCIRREKHISHFSLDEALEVCRKVGAAHSFLTHISHQLEKYEDLCKVLPEGVEPAYDGLSIAF